MAASSSARGARRSPARAERDRGPKGAAGRAGPDPGAASVIPHDLASTLADRIVRLELAPGAHLTEDEVCVEFGVSRSPVREVFRVLEGEGLVVRLARRGVRVAPMSRRDLDDLYACRVVLEGLAAREAAEQLDEEAAAAMQRLLAGMTQSLQGGDVDAFFADNVALTRTIHLASRNPMLIRIVGGIEKQALRYRYFAHVRSPAMLDVALAGQREICGAILQCKPDLAQLRAEKAIRRAHEAIARAIDAAS